jgi:hypothetical protein
MSTDELKEIEKREAEAERIANLVTYGAGVSIFNPRGFSVSNWEKYFSTRGAAEQWLKDIVERAKAVDDVVYARVELYNSDVRAFKTFPSKIMRDAVLKDKDNVIEAYNRYKPINADIAKVLAKGVVFERNEQPGRNVADVAERIDAYNKEYARLIDTYPVN